MTTLALLAKCLEQCWCIPKLLPNDFPQTVYTLYGRMDRFASTLSAVFHGLSSGSRIRRLRSCLVVAHRKFPYCIWTHDGFLEYEILPAASFTGRSLRNRCIYGLLSGHNCDVYMVFQEASSGDRFGECGQLYGGYYTANHDYQSHTADRLRMDHANYSLHLPRLISDCKSWSKVTFAAEGWQHAKNI